MTVSSKLYPETLFHFTKTVDNVSAILKDRSFRLSFAREKIHFGADVREFGVPMVSFCDLRLSECKEHAQSYGRFGIGLTKSWATKKGLNPVIYLNSKSRLCQGLFPALETTYNSLKGACDNDALARETAYMDLFEFVRYGKNYEGMLRRRSGKIVNNYRFANEREWRYVPSKDEARPIVPGAELDDPNNKKRFNDEVSNVRLEFKEGDVRYIIVGSKANRESLIKVINSPQSEWTKKERNRLSACILIMKQIRSDF